MGVCNIAIIDTPYCKAIPLPIVTTWSNTGGLEAKAIGIATIVASSSPITAITVATISLGILIVTRPEEVGRIGAKTSITAGTATICGSI